MDVIRYEHPLNERIRTLMRLEDLYGRALFFAGETAPAAHHAALLALFEIVDVAGRADLKTDILQELERQRQLLAPLKHNPAIEAMVLDAVLSEIDVAGGSLLAQTGKVGQHLRDNDWLMAIKQRTGIPGGACEFDLPAYHHWLNLKPTARQRDLQGWLEPLLPIHSGLSIILRLLRDNGKTTRHTAYHGIFQLMLTTAKVAQLLRLSLAKDTACVPEISANKYALNIRFVGIAGMDAARLRRRRRVRLMLQSLTSMARCERSPARLAAHRRLDKGAGFAFCRALPLIDLGAWRRNHTGARRREEVFPRRSAVVPWF